MTTSYSVFGCWPETRERYAEVYEAASPRSAENQAQAYAAGRGGVLWVCRVADGNLTPADTYTAFVDPTDPRNTSMEGLEPDLPDYVAGDPEWTVFGIAVPHSCRDDQVLWTGERYGDVENATSAGAAEDVARTRLADRGGDLWVCTVLPGRVIAADTYATFVDPDVRST